MSKFGDKIARRLSVFAVTLMLAATFHPESFGQGSTQNAATPGAPAGSYKLSDFDTVNLFSGNLNFNLPLAGLKGRGDFGSSVSLTIEQQWSISEVSADEWHIRNHISPLINAVGHLRINGYIQQTSELCLLYPNAETYWTKYQLHLTFVDQDGTEIRLVDATYKGDEKNICGVTSLNYGSVFASTDGGSLTFVSDSNIIGTDTRTVVGLGATGYLYRNGGYKSRVENGAILWTKDRNGNTTEYEYESGGGFPNGYPAAQVIRDSVGREITFEGGVIEPAPYGLCHKIIYKGFGGGGTSDPH